MVSRLTGYAVQPNKAIVGRNAFAHESGIHQDGVLKERTTYEIMDATEVGLESNSIVLGKHSGRHALRDALEQLGFKVEGNALNAAFKRFKEVADKKKQVTALDLEAIVSDEMRERADAYELAWFEVEAGSRREPLAKVAVTMPSGEEAVGESGGDGPVDAIFRAIQKATGTECELRQYTVAAVTGGEDALGEVTVMLRAAGRLATGQGVATDILEASARAYVRALSNALEGAAIREAEAATAEAAARPRTPGPVARHRVAARSAGSLEGRQGALITGAPRRDRRGDGAGAGRRGRAVALGARRKDRLDELAAQDRGDGGTAVAIEADIADEAQAKRWSRRAHDELGGLDSLVNNAGVMLLGPLQGADTERVADDDRRQPPRPPLLHPRRAAAMRDGGGGDIVNVSSVAGRIAALGAGVYNMTKWGVVGFSEALRQEGAHVGVRVTCVEPGFVETELQGHNTNPSSSSRSRRCARHGRGARRPTDIANAIVYAVCASPST